MPVFHEKSGLEDLTCPNQLDAANYKINVKYDFEKLTLKKPTITQVFVQVLLFVELWFSRMVSLLMFRLRKTQPKEPKQLVEEDLRALRTLSEKRISPPTLAAVRKEEYHTFGAVCISHQHVGCAKQQKDSTGQLDIALKS